MNQIRVAHKLIEKGKLEEALASYRILSGIACDNPCVVYNTAWLLRRLEEYEESLKWHKNTLDLLGSEAVYETGEAMEDESGERAAWNKNELCAMTYFGCGMCYYALKKYDLSIIHLKGHKVWVI